MHAENSEKCASAEELKFRSMLKEKMHNAAVSLLDCSDKLDRIGGHSRLLTY